MYGCNCVGTTPKRCVVSEYYYSKRCSTLTVVAHEVRCIHVATSTAVYTQTDCNTNISYQQYQYLQPGTSGTQYQLPPTTAEKASGKYAAGDTVLYIST